MAGAITTTTQITFGTGGEVGAHLSAEVDGRSGGLNGGKTSFVGGEPVYILVYKSNNVTINNTEVSAGTVFPAAPQLVDVEETITFQNKREASLSKPITGGLTVTWYGRSLGGLTVGADQTSITAGSSGVAVAKVKYKTNAKAYRLSTPVTLNGEADFTILFFVAGVAA